MGRMRDMDQLAKRAQGRPDLSFSMRCLITAAILFLASSLARLPAPGLDPQALTASTGYAPLDAIVKLSTSIIALQFNPVVTALLIFEFFRFALPGMSNWNAKDLEYRGVHARVLLGMAILFALFQGWGVASSLESVETTVPLVTTPGDYFRFAFAMTQIAGTAALVFLANLITRFGIGSGYWVMLVAFALAGLPGELAQLHGNFSQGLLDPLMAIATCATIAGGAVAFSFLFRKGVEAGRTAQQSAADLILPLFLGIALGTFLYGLLVVTSAYFSNMPMSPEMLQESSSLKLALTAGLITLIARVRCRDDQTRGWQVAALSIALFIALDMLRARVGMAVPSADVLAIVVVVLALAWDQCKQLGHRETTASSGSV